MLEIIKTNVSAPAGLTEEQSEFDELNQLAITKLRFCFVFLNNQLVLDSVMGLSILV